MVYAILAALTPVILLLYYILRKDDLVPEPPIWLWRAVWYGVGSAILVLAWGNFIWPGFQTVFPQYADTVVGAVGTAFMDAAIPEEAAKLLMLWLLIRKNPYFDEYFDGIVYATCIGLGFAGLENILYVCGNFDNFMYIAITRALFSVPAHFFFAVTMGYFLSLAYFGGRQKSIYWLLAYIVPVILHGIFDGILMSHAVAPALSGGLTLLFLVFVHYLRKYARGHIEALRRR